MIELEYITVNIELLTKEALKKIEEIEKVNRDIEKECLEFQDPEEHEDYVKIDVSEFVEPKEMDIFITKIVGISDASEKGKCTIRTLADDYTVRSTREDLRNQIRKIKDKY